MADTEMFVFSLLMLGVLLNSAAAQYTPGDQKKVERMRREMNAMKDDLRREIIAGLERVTKETKAGLERVTKENQETKAGLERVTKENQQRVRKRMTPGEGIFVFLYIRF